MTQNGKPALVTISLGWGQQSWAMAAMSALAKLPPADVAIHSDTTWERTPTRLFAEYWTPWLQAHGIRVSTVFPRDPRIAQRRAIMPPVYTIRRSDGKRGQSPRQCTRDWKVRPPKRLIRHIMRALEIPLLPGIVEQWIGFTSDETHRCSPSPVAYIRKRYPLIELGMSRADVVEWLRTRGLGVPPKSACIICPFRTDTAWHEIRTNQPWDWEKAVILDRAIRKRDLTHDCYLHESCQPLDVAIDQQPLLFTNNAAASAKRRPPRGHTRTHSLGDKKQDPDMGPKRFPQKKGAHRSSHREPPS